MTTSRLTTVWVVRDPSPGIESEMEDIFWQTTMNDLAKYIIGGAVVQNKGRDSDTFWETENHAVYVDENEARADAEKRIDP